MPTLPRFLELLIVASIAAIAASVITPSRPDMVARKKAAQALYQVNLNTSAVIIAQHTANAAIAPRIPSSKAEVDAFCATGALPVRTR